MSHVQALVLDIEVGVIAAIALIRYLLTRG